VKISVITAVFNSRDTIAQAIQSILEQDYADVELIVIDGASTDGTREILELYRDSIDVLISEPDRGVYDALNKGIGLAGGDVVGFLHADDLFADRQALQRVAAMIETTGTTSVYGDLVYVRKENPESIVRYWRSGAFSIARLRRGWMPPHPTLYVRRSVFERFGGFDCSFHIAADYDWILRFLGRERLSCAYIPEVLVKMRVGGISNRSIANIFRKSREDYRALVANRVGGIGTLMLKNLRKVPQFFVRPTG
jgi:glycosyltransferase involved in cell wall biosynthesis